MRGPTLLRPAMLKHNRLQRVALVIVSFLMVAMVLSGCHSYPFQVVKWNMLRPTPYVRARRKPAPRSWSPQDATVCWLGHATVLINFYGTTILTDPVLVKRLAPPHLWGHVNLGIRRIHELPLSFRDLPAIDLVLLSHAHYDHWDIASLNYFDQRTTAVIPEGDADILPKGRFGEVVELRWGQSRRFGEVEIKAFYVAHWGQRPGADNSHFRGFNGYVISGRGRRIVFIGDTAFGRWRPSTEPRTCRPAWTVDALDWRGLAGPGPIDLCILPIGSYYYHMNHCTPEEAWRIFKQLDGRWFLPTHWGTFILCPPDELPPREPIERLRRAAGPDAGRIVCDEPGKVFVLP